MSYNKKLRKLYSFGLTFYQTKSALNESYFEVVTLGREVGEGELRKREEIPEEKKGKETRGKGLRGPGKRGRGTEDIASTLHRKYIETNGVSRQRTGDGNWK